VRMLLENKADVNARACNGDKPEDVARKNHHTDIVRLLRLARQ